MIDRYAFDEGDLEAREYFYREGHLDGYPILGTDMTYEDLEIWIEHVHRSLSCTANMVVETRDADRMSALQGYRPIRHGGLIDWCVEF